MKRTFDFRSKSTKNKREQEAAEYNWEMLEEESWEGNEEEYYEEETGEYYAEETGEDYAEDSEEYYSEEYEGEGTEEYYSEEGEEYYSEENGEYYEEDAGLVYYTESGEEYYEEYDGEDPQTYYEQDGYVSEDAEDRRERKAIVPVSKWMDYMVVIGAVAMLLVAVVFGVILFTQNKKGNSDDNVQQVGNQLANIQVIGEAGLLAMSDAQKALLAATDIPQVTTPPEEEEDTDYEEEEYEFDVTVKLSFTSIEKDLKIKFLNRDTGKLVGNVPFGVEITNPDGDTLFWSDDDMDGIIYKKNLPAGRYTVKMQELEGEKYKTYAISSVESKVDVKSKLVYEKVDVTAEIKTESQVDVKKEDTKNNNTIVEEYMQDTVAWVESSVLTESFEEVTKADIPDPMTLAMGGLFVRLSAEGPDLSTPEPEATATPAPTATPEPEITPTPTPEPESTATPAPTSTPAPTATPEPEGTPEPSVTPEPSESPEPSETPEPSESPKLEKVALEKKTAVIYLEDKATELSVTLTPGDLEDVKLEAETSDATIAKVSIVNGKVVIEGLKEGKNVTITVSAKIGDTDPVKDTCTVEVRANPKKDMKNVLKDKQGREIFVFENNQYRNAYYADYYTFSKFFVKNDVKYTGWQTINGKVLYFDATGKCVTGQQVIQGVKYQFASDGSLVTGTGTMGIDVSKWNGKIDWNAVKNAGVSYVIIRCGYRGSSQGALIVDSKFKENIKGANAAGLKVGVYFFTQAIDKNEALEEASMVLELIKDYKISYPVFLDVETSGGRADSLNVATRTEICKTFCETIKQYGYTPGIYANKTWLETKLDMNVLNAYKVWLAQYASEPTYKGRYDMWQYKDTGKISGISGNVDLNRSYLGY